MAYCRMSLLRLGGESKGKGKEQALVAVPSLTRDEQVRVGLRLRSHMELTLARAD